MSAESARSRRLLVALCGTALFAPITAAPLAAFAQEAPLFSCIVPLVSETAPQIHASPGGGWLVKTDKGWLLARNANGKIAVTPVGNADSATGARFYQLGEVLLILANKRSLVARQSGETVTIEPTDITNTVGAGGANEVPGGVLISGETGVFFARAAGGTIRVTRVEGVPADHIRTALALPGGGVLIDFLSGLFFARFENNSITVEPVRTFDTAGVRRILDFPGIGALIATNKALFVARVSDGAVAVEPAGDIGELEDSYHLPAIGTLIQTGKGSFLASHANGAVSVRQVAGPATGLVRRVHALPGGGLLISADKGVFFTRLVNGTLSLAAIDVSAVGTVYDVRDFADLGVLVATGVGLFEARDTNGTPSLTRVRGGDGSWSFFREVSRGRVLVAGRRGLFLAQKSDGVLTLTPASPDNIASVRSMGDFPGGGILIVTGEGLFLARVSERGFTFARGASEITGRVHDARVASDGTTLVRADRGLFVGIRTSLADARVEIQDQEKLNGSATGADRYLRLKLTHACAPAADRLGLKVRITKPGESAINSERESVSPHADSAEVGFHKEIDKPGGWSFQLVATADGMERPIGEPRVLEFVAPGPASSWLDRWWKMLAYIFSIVLVLFNIALFVAARRSAWAWRLATDDGLGTWVGPFAKLALSHIPAAQLWILDLYFQLVRAHLPPPRPFLPLPLKDKDDALKPSAQAIVPPWTGRRRWIQGGSGMGKTALFREITESHFRDHATAFAARAKWGCVLVAFAARDFAGSGEDKDDPAWVVEAVRDTLSGEGLTFQSNALLLRFLESGTIGVAIDGLNEVDRTRAVTAFSRAFPNAPMLVTSQQAGGERFTTWRLPTDIRDFTADLLRLHLTAEQAEIVMRRIAASGLKDAIRSGYDVRLVLDLAKHDPEHAVLPADRMGLYAAVIEAGWPIADDENARREQQAKTAAAAWRMVSERKANEDMRRIKSDKSDADLLPARLLQALADHRPVRLVRRAGSNAFEFVHDQMHAYLAARWFAQDGWSVGELEKMVGGSSIWAQSPDARRILWGFAAALLDDERLVALRLRVEDKEDWDVLRRALKAEAERRGLVASAPAPA
jgi:hypothetical protein